MVGFACLTHSLLVTSPEGADYGSRSLLNTSRSQVSRIGRDPTQWPPEVEGRLRGSPLPSLRENGK